MHHKVQTGGVSKNIFDEPFSEIFNTFGFAKTIDDRGEEISEEHSHHKKTQLH